MPSALSRDQLNHLAKLGAVTRLAEIRREQAILNAMMNGGTTSASTPPFPAPRRAKRRRVAWSAAQRAAVSERMKKYWAARRAGRKK